MGTVRVTSDLCIYIYIYIYICRYPFYYFIFRSGLRPTKLTCSFLSLNKALIDRNSTGTIFSSREYVIVENIYVLFVCHVYPLTFVSKQMQS